ncbi:insecticyanin-A-like [Ostrinia furnacalis]|uniref:insecticyanin-A-like n=1 Tax=Ostrinia furnacalis TaxID=93504 RepID=UPI00103F972B|nr:insecticyanin-A-like [Ostrinia furnacalis]
MIKLIVFLFSFCGVYGYFTLPGKCPTNVAAKDDFRLEDFYGKWYQAYFYSSDGQRKNNCSVIELGIEPFDSYKSGASPIHLNQSRVDRGLFHRYSIATVRPPASGSVSGSLELEYTFKNAPRRLMTRNYKLEILATNYNFYATAYTCQYSPLIDKHYIYVWILSRKTSLNDVSKELALKSLKNIGINEEKLVKDDQTKCSPKYYEDTPTEPTTFRYSIPI